MHIRRPGDLLPAFDFSVCVLLTPVPVHPHAFGAEDGLASCAVPAFQCAQFDQPLCTDKRPVTPVPVPGLRARCSLAASRHSHARPPRRECIDPFTDISRSHVLRPEVRGVRALGRGPSALGREERMCRPRPAAPLRHPCGTPAARRRSPDGAAMREGVSDASLGVRIRHSDLSGRRLLGSDASAPSSACTGMRPRSASSGSSRPATRARLAALVLAVAHAPWLAVVFRPAGCFAQMPVPTPQLARW